MCKENCSECLQDNCRDDCIHADECGCEGMCQYYEVEE